MDADYADNIALLANTPTQAKFLLHSLEQAAGGIGLHMNANMCFNQGDISTLNDSSLKLVYKFKSWKPHPTKQQVYGHLPPISKTI